MAGRWRQRPQGHLDEAAVRDKARWSEKTASCCEITGGCCEITASCCEMTPSSCEKTRGWCEITASCCEMTPSSCEKTRGWCENTRASGLSSGAAASGYGAGGDEAARPSFI